MKESFRPNLYLALVHHPVVNKRGSVITSAVTNLDLHDMARAARTYGVRAFYVITPLSDQKTLVDRITGHWTTGVGGEINPTRRAALELIRTKDSIEEAAREIELAEQSPPKIVVTSARENPGSMGFDALRAEIKDGRPYVLTFGTAWGLTEAFIAASDYVLEPVKGNTDYNHLSVRSATSIILDRLVG